MMIKSGSNPYGYWVLSPCHHYYRFNVPCGGDNDVA